eukprot:GHUV01039683.1.p2 GENE.GHUV01039683.1~~GHUV01039683.1.p2  ORF type:complete len:108 (+),score=3.71 GHUV01039683.1:60-383(+)
MHSDTAVMQRGRKSQGLGLWWLAPGSDLGRQDGKEGHLVRISIILCLSGLPVRTAIPEAPWCAPLDDAAVQLPEACTYLGTCHLETRGAEGPRRPLLLSSSTLSWGP